MLFVLIIGGEITLYDMYDKMLMNFLWALQNTIYAKDGTLRVRKLYCALIFSIQSGGKRIKSNESDIKLFKAQVQEEVDSTKARATKISKMAQQVKTLLNQLKDIRSTKRKMLQEIWGFDSETRFYLKEKRAKNKSKAKWNEGHA